MKPENVHHFFEPLHIPDRLFFGFAVVTFLLTLGSSIWSWQFLPAQLPVHFSVWGEPDAWARTTWWTVFSLPILQLLLVSLIGWAYHHPEYTHLPGLRWESLTGTRKRWVTMVVRHLLAMVAVWTALLLFALSLATVAAAFSLSTQGIMTLVWIIAGLFFLTLGMWLLMFRQWMTTVSTTTKRARS